MFEAGNKMALTRCVTGDTVASTSLDVKEARYCNGVVLV